MIHLGSIGFNLVNLGYMRIYMVEQGYIGKPIHSQGFPIDE